MTLVREQEILHLEEVPPQLNSRHSSPSSSFGGSPPKLSSSISSLESVTNLTPSSSSLDSSPSLKHVTVQTTVKERSSFPTPSSSPSRSSSSSFSPTSIPAIPFHQAINHSAEPIEPPYNLLALSTESIQILARYLRARPFQRDFELVIGTACGASWESRLLGLLTSLGVRFRLGSIMRRRVVLKMPSAPHEAMGSFLPFYAGPVLEKEVENGEWAQGGEFYFEASTRVVLDESVANRDVKEPDGIVKFYAAGKPESWKHTIPVIVTECIWSERKSKAKEDLIRWIQDRDNLADGNQVRAPNLAIALSAPRLASPDDENPIEIIVVARHLSVAKTSPTPGVTLKERRSHLFADLPKRVEVVRLYRWGREADVTELTLPKMLLVWDRKDDGSVITVSRERCLKWFRHVVSQMSVHARQVGEWKEQLEERKAEGMKELSELKAREEREKADASSRTDSRAQERTAKKEKALDPTRIL